MITIEHLCTQIKGLRPQDVERWIGKSWVRADGAAESYALQEIDVARVRLIVELRDTMRVNEEALPVVLGLLDQLYEARLLRRLRIVPMPSNAVPSSRSEDGSGTLVAGSAGSTGSVTGVE